MKTPIDKLNLSARVYNALRRSGFDTIEELQQLTKNDLLSIRNIGLKSREELTLSLQEHDLLLKKEETPTLQDSKRMRVIKPFFKLTPFEKESVREAAKGLLSGDIKSVFLMRFKHRIVTFREIAEKLNLSREDVINLYCSGRCFLVQEYPHLEYIIPLQRIEL